MTDPVIAYCTAYLAVMGVAFALLAVANERYSVPHSKGPTTVTNPPAFTAADERAFIRLLSSDPGMVYADVVDRREQPEPPVVEPEPDQDGDDDGTHVHVCVRTPDGATLEASAWLPNPTSSAEAAAAVKRCSAGVLAQLVAPGGAG